MPNPISVLGVGDLSRGARTIRGTRPGFAVHDRPLPGKPALSAAHSFIGETMGITSTFWNESTGHCDCCGRASKKIWGDLSDATGTRAVYFVHWTIDAPEHFPNVDLVLGQWGEGAEPANRDLVSLAFRPGADGGSFMVIDGQGRPPDKRTVCGRALRRDEVVGTPLPAHVFSLVDALWLTEPRIAEVRELKVLT